jgi:hypothetical protein
MSIVLASAAPEDRDDLTVAPVPLKPHSYPVWLVAGAFLVAGAVAYSAIIMPPYLRAQNAMWRAEAAIEKGDRGAAELQLLDVLSTFPTSKRARIDIAVMLLADPEKAHQERGLGYLGGIVLDKHEWKRVSAVLPERFKDQFETVKK